MHEQILKSSICICTSDELSKQLYTLYMYDSVTLLLCTTTYYATVHCQPQHHHVTAQSNRKNKDAYMFQHFILWIIHDGVNPYISTGKSPQHKTSSPNYSVKDWIGTTLVSVVNHGLYYVPTTCIISLSHNCKTDLDVIMI